MRSVWIGTAALAFGLVLAGSPASARNPGQDRLVAVSKVVDTRIDENARPQSWTLTPGLNPDTFSVEVAPGQTREVCFVSGAASLCRTVQSGDQFDLVITFEGVDYPTRIATVPPAAVFDAAYRAEHDGRTEILIPEVYELVNIAIAMTPTGFSDPNMVAKSPPYYSEVKAWFGDSLDDPLLAALDAELKADSFAYFHLKMNAYAFEYDENGRIVKSRVYDRTGFAGDTVNHLEPFIDRLQAFADRTGFRDFYRAHRPFYDSQTAYIRDQIDIAGGLAWLQAAFPDVKPYDSVKIILSPLVSGQQSLTTYEGNGFRELQPHVNFPYGDISRSGLSASDFALNQGAILFTEMNHGFINPTAEPYAGRIAEVFADRAFWAREGTSSESYGNAQSLFNEYMNWALVSLYFNDRASPEGRDVMIRRLEPYMVRTRGFPQFEAFNRFLVDLYRQRAPGETVADLYPRIIDWAKAHAAAARPAP